jgi:putative chitinase
MFITADRIRALAPRVAPAVADALAGALETAMPQFGIVALLPRAHFMAQVCHESEGFTRFEENLRYIHASAIAATWPRLTGRALDLVGKPEALANAAYSNRGGNGDEPGGDGWRYRGRGLIQLTFRHNYRRAGDALGDDLEGNPDQAAEPDMAALTALWFWHDTNCTTHAILDDVDAVTRAINGPGRAGLTQRRALTEQAKLIFI